MNKRGLFGKIFLGIILIILIFLGITAYQAYDLVNTVTSQVSEIENDVSALKGGDCSKISSIETRIILVESKVSSACKNPVINLASQNIEGLPANCLNYKTLRQEAEYSLNDAKKNCDVRILNNFTKEAIQDYLNNISSNNYKEYASLFNISIENKSESEAISLVKNYLSSLK